MKRLISSIKAFCSKLFSNFVESRLISEYPAADELSQRRTDRPSDDPRADARQPMVGAF